MASRYSRYDPDRRSRSPRDRSPDRFDRGPQYGDGDRRRSSAEGRSNAPGFQPNRDGFGDSLRREPPRGPKALVDAPSGPRGGGFSGDFRGRGRGRGRVWPARDDSRERGRERDIDYRDRYRDERSRDRDRERDRDRDRDWRDSRDFRGPRRSPPPGRGRTPPRDFRDRDRDGPPPDADRSRRGSRDGGPPSAGSSNSEPQFGPPPFNRGGSFMRGRGRGGRGDWPSDRGRGRTPYEDRGDRYPRSRSQEARWGRERDDRDRGPRYPEVDIRRDPRDDRDRIDRELIRSKKEGRPSISQEPSTQTKEVSPPPVAPSAPAFGSVPSRNLGGGDATGIASGTAKPPPGAPRAPLSDRPGSSGTAGPNDNAASPAQRRSESHDSPTIPIGPRAQQQLQQRPSSMQWINPDMKKLPPQSPKMMRAQTFTQGGSAPLRRESTYGDQLEQKRPRSSDADSDPPGLGIDNRARQHQSAEPGEITVKSESGKDVASMESAVPAQEKLVKESFMHGEPAKHTIETRRKRPVVGVVRFAVPPKKSLADQDSESDDDEDMADYFAMEIEKTESELSKLPQPNLPLQVVARYAALSHGSMARILSESEGLTDIVGPIPETLDFEMSKADEATSAKVTEELQPPTPATDVAQTTGADVSATVEPVASTTELSAKAEAMDIDPPTAPTANLDVPQPKDAAPVGRASRASSRPASRSGALRSGAAKQDRQQTPGALSTAAEGAASKPPSTPSQVPDDDDETESEDEAYLDLETVRRFMTTPPLDSLPDYSCDSWTKDKEFLASLDTDPLVDGYVAEHLGKIHIQEGTEQQRERQIYMGNYIRYLGFTLSSDPAAVKSRDKFNVDAPVIEPVGVLPPEPKPEGRSTGRRFASERDLERVLQASMREDEERRERELRAQKEKYRSEKDAIIPDMYWDAEQRAKAQYTDRSGYTPQDRLVAAWQVLPPSNNFTEEEHELFEKRYLENPKQWGKIAEIIPHRDFRACIQYYYLMKKNLNLKEKLKKQPKRRKKGGRGKQRSSALVSELGNGEETEENADTGENGERRRPRRAAAPTWGFEQPATDSENATPAGTPGRRGASAAARGEQGEKVDGRRGRRRNVNKDKDKEKEKDKDGKAAKANQSLSVTPGGTSSKRRSRSSSRVPAGEVPAPQPAEGGRIPPGYEQPIPPGIHPPFAVQQQPPVPGLERTKGMTASSISDVMAAPSLRPEPPPPPQPAMTTFNLAQAQTDRKAPAQASSYWSVSESNDFPHLLRSFGSDWTAIAAHMGSKTAVMVKNYFVRQKDQGKSEWEAFVQEADTKRARGEKRPEPPQPTTGGRGRRYDNSTVGSARPLAVAPGMEMHADVAQVKMDPAAQPGRSPAFSGYGVPIAQAPTQQPLSQPGQPPLAQQQQPPAAQPVSQAMSPGTRPLRAPLQSFGFPEQRERESAGQGQRAPLAQKGGPVPELREQRPLAPGHPDPMLERQQRDRERERERELARQPERQTELGPGRHYDQPFGHRHQPSLGRGDPLSLARPSSQEAGRAAGVQPYPPSIQQQQQQQQQGPHGVRAMMEHPSVAQSPPLGPGARPMSSIQQRQPTGPGPGPEGYGPPPSANPPSRPAPEPRKTSNIMSLLNDDPPPASKRVSDMSNPPSGPSSTPPPSSMGRAPPPQPPSQIRREPESQYPPYGRPSGGASGMPSLKPTYSGSPNPPPHISGRPGMGMGNEPPAPERDPYYRGHPYQPGHQSGNSSPQTSHRYPPSAQQGGQGPYPPQSGYPAGYGPGQAPPPHAASPPPPQYGGHGPAPRGREVHQSNGRENAWPQQPSGSGGWSNQPPKTSQGPPPGQSWAPHPSSTPKPSTPAQAWASAPPPQHGGIRDERGGYGSSSQPPQHAMQSRYPPPGSRPPEPVPSPAPGYPRYSSTPGPGPRDPREPPRSYTPGGYDGRGPPPGPGYPVPDPRDMQMRDGRDPRDPRDPRDARDPRDVMARGLRPHEYDRHPDQYRR